MAFGINTNTYSAVDAVKAARAAGFSPANAYIAAAIALAETPDRNASAIHVNADGSRDLGVWQINDKANADIIAKYGDPFNLQQNAKMAHAVYLRQGWKAWVTYNSGAYKANLPFVHQVPGSSQGGGKTSSGGLKPGLLDKGGAIRNALNPFSELLDPALWKRFGLIVLGGLLLIVGIVIMLESNSTTRKLTETAVLA